MRYNELFNDGYQFKFEFKPIDDEFSKTYYTIIKDSNVDTYKNGILNI